jgi:hypothetical protein
MSSPGANQHVTFSAPAVVFDSDDEADLGNARLTSPIFTGRAACIILDKLSHKIKILLNSIPVDGEPGI